MLLAAGRGARLCPLTDQMPKPMLPVAGRPILEHVVRWLARYDVRDMVINLHHLPDVVRDHFGDGSRFGARIAYAYEPKILGTGGALRANAGHFGDETFLVVYADNLNVYDLHAFIARHSESHALATVGVFEREDVTGSGMVVLDAKDRIVAFREKPSPDEVVSRWVNAGIIVAEPSFLDAIADREVSDISRDVLPVLLDSGSPLQAFRVAAHYWADSLEDYDRLQRLAARGDLAPFFEPEVLDGEDAGAP